MVNKHCLFVMLTPAIKKNFVTIILLSISGCIKSSTVFCISLSVWTSVCYWNESHWCLISISWRQQIKRTRWSTRNWCKWMSRSTLLIPCDPFLLFMSLFLFFTSCWVTRRRREENVVSFTTFSPFCERVWEPSHALLSALVHRYILAN